MKGVMFNLLEDFIVEGWSEETYETIFARCPLHTTEPFVGPGTYPDADMLAIVSATSAQLGLSVPETLRRFGRFLAPELVARFPIFAEGFSHPKPFLLSIHDVVHVEVKKLMPSAQPPDFTYEDRGPDGLCVRYSSARGLCHLMEGLLDGVADAFGVRIAHHQRTCRHRGGEHCTFELTFAEPWQDAA